MADDPTTPTDQERPKGRVGLPPGKMTQAHKDALAEGRRRGQLVRKYLEELERTRPKRGRPITRDGLQKQIAELDRKLEQAKDALEKLDLVQRKIDRERQLKEFDEPVDLAAAEAGFIEVAKAYGDSKGISAQAWREMKVPPEVLKRAGIA